MGIITPYGTGPSPVYYGSGYLPAADYWRLGAIFGLIFLAVFMVTSVPLGTRRGLSKKLGTISRQTHQTDRR